MQTAENQIHVVRDRVDSVERTSALRALHSLEHGVVVCELAPGRSSLQWLANDLLVALGKREDATGAGRNARKSWWRAIVWVLAEHVTDLVVPRAGLLRSPQWAQLAEFAAVCRVNLWLVVQGRPPTRAHRAVIEDWLAHTIEYEALVDHLRPSAKRELEASPGAQLPEVPHLDFPVFRAACRTLLSPHDFASVDSVYTETFADVSRALGRRRIVELDRAARICCDQVTRALDFNEALTRVRAAQAALFHRGILAGVRIPILANNGPRHPLDQAGVNALRAYAAPEYPCLGALALAYGLEPASLHRLTVQAITDDGGFEEEGSPSVPVNALLLAQRLQRLWDGASDTDPLFCKWHSSVPAAGDRPPATAQSLYNRFRTIGVDTGIFTPGRWTRRAAVSPIRQAESFGISLRQIPGAEETS